MSAEQGCLQRCADLRLGRNNLFDLVRLYAAVQVLLVHGQVHLGLKWPSWLMQCFSLPGVPLFFSISGFLVGLSWLRLQNQWRIYAWHRGLRIFPALWFCLLFTLLILIAAGKTGFLLSPREGFGCRSGDRCAGVQPWLEGFGGGCDQWQPLDDSCRTAVLCSFHSYC